MSSFIKERNGVSAKEIVAVLGLHPTGIFRHLKKLINKKLIYKTGHVPNVLYYPLMNNEKGFLLKQNAINWATQKIGVPPESQIYCQSRDVFQARQDKLPKELNSVIKDEQQSFLLSAVVGEIGNNSFDHNFGNWPDVPGIYFHINTCERVIILADRGNGVFATLKKVRKDIQDDLGALRVAFLEIVSGRSPEQRGNGLKFVKKVAESCKIKINFYSGNAMCSIESGQTKFTLSENNVRGTVAIINF